MAEGGRVDAYAQAFFGVARAEQHGGAVEDDLFRFARALEADDHLRGALADRALPAERRIAVVEELMGGAAMPASVGLVSMVVGADRATDLPAIVDRFLELSAEERRHDVAEVRAAVPLDDRLRDRLSKALSDATGKEIEVKVVVDPTVLGGVVARIGDTVIDGTVRRRLEQLKERI
ncbi:MAG TPA: ATP synthase F1 subunit delta [Acidimicrobiia bacterium]|nr:ATP synthase F1 subunit delta [Acidimicrobiia bacterium]